MVDAKKRQDENKGGEWSRKAVIKICSFSHSCGLKQNSLLIRSVVDLY